MLYGEVKLLSHVPLFVTPWTVAHQAPPSMDFFRQGYWSGLPFTSPGDLPGPGIESGSPILQADALPSEPPGKLWGRTFFILYMVMCMCCAILSHSVVSDSETPWSVARQASLSMGILQAGILEWVSMPSSRRSVYMLLQNS